MRDTILCVALVLGIVLAGFLAVVVPAKFLTNYQCDKYGEISGLETQTYALVCMVKDEQLGWMSSEERKASRFAEQLKVPQ